MLGAFTLAYPLVVYLGLGRFEPRWMALPLVALALLRAVITREKIWLLGAAGAGALALGSAVANHALPLKLYPVLLNCILLGLFATSLVHPPSVIERLARVRERDLPAAAIEYTRKVTQVWCGFFVLNGSLALGTALWASDAAWALYNGLIAYVLIGLLLSGEWLVRRRVRARRAHA